MLLNMKCTMEELATAELNEFVDKRGVEDATSVTFGDYTIIECVSDNEQGKVCVAEHSTSSQKIVLKFMRLCSCEGTVSDKRRARAQQEIQVLSSAKHPNIVQYYGSLETPRFVVLALEHLEEDTLLDFMRMRHRLDEKKARVLFKQLVSAMDYLHSHNIVHNNLKMSQIVLKNKKEIRLVGFLSSKKFEWTSEMDPAVALSFTAAPEMINGVKYTGPEVDIWSMGIVLYYILCGKRPFDGASFKIVSSKITTGKFSLPDYLSEEAKDLLTGMLTVDKKLRIKMADVLAHPWITM
ncbi:hypothetical protein GGF46_001051 [Coemansia sp. RSA 552]|nr:hypothetical protein GGF46_001051 [Coemansia sp. RSA 552]